MLTSQERFIFIVLAPLLLNYEKTSNWRALYDRLNKAKDEWNEILKEVDKDLAYKKIKDNGRYSGSPSSQVNLARNVRMHVNEQNICVCLFNYLLWSFSE